MQISLLTLLEEALLPVTRESTLIPTKFSEEMVTGERSVIVSCTIQFRSDCVS